MQTLAQATFILYVLEVVVDKHNFFPTKDTNDQKASAFACVACLYI